MHIHNLGYVPILSFLPLVSGLGGYTLPVNEEAPLPEMTIYLKDQNRQFTKGKVSVSIALPNFEVYYRDASVGSKRRHVSKADVEITEPESGIVFDEGSWMAVPNDDFIIDKDSITTISLTATVTVQLLDDGREWVKEAGIAVEAGRPDDVSWVNSPESAVMEVANGATIEDLKIRTFDCRGNVTGPARGELWRVEVTGDEWFDIPSAGAGKKPGKQGSKTKWTVRIEAWLEKILMCFSQRATANTAYFPIDSTDR